jgi:elongation factor 1-beta
VLRSLAGLRLDSGLYTANAFTLAVIDQWMDFYWTELAPALAHPQLPAAQQTVSAGLAVFDAYLLSNTYIGGGQTPTLADYVLYNGLRTSEAAVKSHVNVSRWFDTIQNQPAVLAVLNPGASASASASASAKPAAAAAPKPAAAAAGDDSDDLGLSDSDDDEDTKKMMAAKAAATKAVQDRQQAKAAQGNAKSDIAFDIKPLETLEDKDENQKAMENLLAKVRSVELDGLRWMSYQFIDVAFGIKKLRIMCQIIDIKIPGGPDQVKETIEEQPWCEELIQSIDVFSFQMAA